MIELKKVNLFFNPGKHVLKDIELTIQAGCSTALLGANGSGKTSLLWVIAGIYKYKGEIIFRNQGRLNGGSKELRDKTGVVFQNPDEQLFMPTVREELALTLLQKHDRVDEALIGEIMERFGIVELADRAPHKLSEGEKKKVALSAALVAKPELLILDEPTSDLDLPGKKEFLKLINSLEQTRLVATHDLEFARNCCDRGVILESGRVVAEGKFEELIDNRRLLESCGLI